MKRKTEGGSYTAAAETPFELLPEILTIEEVGQFLRIGRNSAYDLAKRGALRSIRVTERRLVITKADLGAFLGLSNYGVAGTPKDNN